MERRVHRAMVWTIFLKDLRDAIRDGRVLLALLVPMGLGLFYNVLFDDETPRPTATVAYTSSAPSRLPEQLREVIGETVDLTLTEQPSRAAVKALIDDQTADLGLVIPAGFDAAVLAGRSPPLLVLLPASRGVVRNYVTGALDEALRRLANQPAPARIERQQAAAEAGEELIFDRIGPAPYFVLTSALFLAVMVALFAVPIILTEEVEKKTLDALVLVASYADVVIAKALVGLVYTGVATVLLLTLTRSHIERPLPFGLALLTLSVALMGVGLLIGELFRSANQLNTWSSVILIPFLGPVYGVGLPTPRLVDLILLALPTSQATRLVMNAALGERLFDRPWLSYLVIVAWGIAAYAVVLWRLSRRRG